MLESLEQRALLAVTSLITEATVARAHVPTSAIQFADLGLEWTGTDSSFDDSAWQSTPIGGPNGVGSPAAKYGAYMGLNLQEAMQGKSPSALVRIPFTANNVSSFDTLTLKMRFEDGFIAYLNGVEVCRQFAPAGYSIWNAVAIATNVEATASYTTFDVSEHLSALRSGANVLAIRGFNASQSQNDFLIQAALDAETPDAPPTANNDATSVEQGATTVIAVLANDSPGSAAIDPRTVQVVDQPDHGTVTVNPSTGAITYVPAAGFRGTDTLTYRVRDASSVPTPGDDTQDVTVVSSTALHQRRIPTAADAAIGTTWTGGNEPFNATNWTTAPGGVGYDDHPAVDFTPFIADNVRQQMFNINGSAYMRVPFTVTEPAAVTGLRLRMRVDDGFIAYINGVAVAMERAPVAPTWNSLSTAGVPTDSDAIIQQEYLIPINGINLRPGTGANILAIHGLNTTVGSSDFLIQPELITEVATTGIWSNEATVTVTVGGTGPLAVNDSASTTGTTPVVIPVLANDQVAPPPNDYPLRPESVTIVSPPANGTATVNLDTGAVIYQANPGFSGQDTFAYTVRDSGPVNGNNQTTVVLPRSSDNWRYLDTGVDPGPNWRDANFNDADWKVGTAQLGYGDVQTTVIATVPTAAFRKAVTFPSGPIESLTIRLLRDDGAAVYLNGVEIRRDNLAPNAAWGDFTIGASVDAINEETYFETTLTAAQLAALGVPIHPGENIVAAEVHQIAVNSSDVGFDVEVVATHAQAAGLESNPATVTVNVAAANIAPTAVGDASFTRIGQPVVINVLANDTPGGSPINAGSVAIVAAPEHGTAVVQQDGRIVYSPSSAFFGQDTLFYTVRDTAGRVSNPAQVVISVLGVGPTAVDDVAETIGTTPVEVGVMFNDLEAAPPEDYPLRADSITIVRPPANGTATVDTAEGLIVYQANPGFSGVDTLEYTIRDAAPVGGESASIAVLPRESVWKYLDTGVDQGTAWREFAFNDSAWASGQAELGYADNPTTTVSYGPDSSNKYITTYFRKSFNLDNPAAIQQLRVLASYDDGAVVYINGVEVARSNNLPNGPINYNTFAVPDHEGGFFEELRTLSGEQLAMLRGGTNVVAVEIHQVGSSSSDLTMDLELVAQVSGRTGRVSNPATVSISVASTNAPPIANPDSAFTLAGQTVQIDVLANDVARGAPLNVGSVAIVGGPAHGTAVVGASGRVAYTPATAFLGDDSFTYTVRDNAGRVSNVTTVSVRTAGSIVSVRDDEYFVDEDDLLIVPAQFGVLANDTSSGGSVVSASVVEPPLFGTLTLAANGGFQYKPNANFTGLDSFRYRGADSNGTSAIAEVSLHVSPSPDAPFAFGDVYWTTVNTPLVVTAAPASRQMLVAKGATWRYLDTGVVPSTNWRQPQYEDSTWLSGPAQLGYGDGDEATVVSFGDDFNQRRITTYFRHEFNVDDLALVHALELGLLRDDGAAVYLNGSRVALSNLSEANLNSNSLASSAAAGAEETTFFTFELHPSVLVAGRNVIAVEVHQSSAASNDLSFDLFLRGSVAGPVSGGVLANDIDPDGDYLTATVVTPPAHGTLAMTADGGFIYTPNAGFEGSDTFNYKASDGTRDSNVTTVVLNVTSIGLLPGDLNDDGFVNAADLAVVVRGLGMAEGADKLRGDANGDGCVDLRDVLEVQRAMGAQRPVGAAAGAIVVSARNADANAASDVVIAARASRASLVATRRERVAGTHTTGATLLGMANVDRTFANWESGGESTSARTLRGGRRR